LWRAAKFDFIREFLSRPIAILSLKKGGSMLYSKKIGSTELSSILPATKTIQNLNDKLKSFGLAPKDWIVEKIDSKYVITNQENQDFKFVGYSTEDLADWRSLHLLSL
jgi:hypothetical protein